MAGLLLGVRKGDTILLDRVPVRVVDVGPAGSTVTLCTSLGPEVRLRMFRSTQLGLTRLTLVRALARQGRQARLRIEAPSEIRISRRVEMSFANLTPHEIVVVHPSGHRVAWPASGQVARVATEVTLDEPMEGIPTVRQRRGAVVGLPEPQEGVTLIVSAMVLEAVRGWRQDVVAPDTGPDSVVRDESGRIVGVRRLLRA